MVLFLLICAIGAWLFWRLAIWSAKVALRLTLGFVLGFALMACFLLLV